MRSALLGAVAVGAVALASAAHATSRVVDINNAVATVGAGSIVSGGELLVRGLSRAGTSVVNVISFTPGDSSLSLEASWIVLGARFRLLGVNIDLIDGSGNVIASDTFQGLFGGTAISTLEATGLVPGTRYQLKLTGIAAGRASYTMAVRPQPPAVP